MTEPIAQAVAGHNALLRERVVGPRMAAMRKDLDRVVEDIMFRSQRASPNSRRVAGSGREL